MNFTAIKEKIKINRISITFNKWNDTFHHIQYIPKVKPPIYRLTYPIYTYIVLSLIILFFGFLFIRTLYKENQIKTNLINPIDDTHKKEEDEIINEPIVLIREEIVNESAVSNPRNNNSVLYLVLQVKPEEVNDLDKKVDLDVLVKKIKREIEDRISKIK